uniref:Uncharacterized protein n=1 Tax=Steinernema glaseri TaxID=37863 RepID=A0A1I7ZXA4_9BILA
MAREGDELLCTYFVALNYASEEHDMGCLPSEAKERVRFGSVRKFENLRNERYKYLGFYFAWTFWKTPQNLQSCRGYMEGNGQNQSRMGTEARIFAIHHKLQ